WNDIIGPIDGNISNSTKEKASICLEGKFKGSLEEWETYCLAIASSKFLMGEAKNINFKKAYFSWAVTDNAVEKIRSGHYILGNRGDVFDEKISMLKN